MLVAIIIRETSWVVALIGLAAHAMLALFMSTGESALHILSFDFSLGGVTGTQGVGVCSAEVCSLYPHS